MNESIGRRRALAAIAGALGAAWSFAAAGLYGVFLSTPLRRKREPVMVKLGSESEARDTFARFNVKYDVADGWQMRSESKIVYMRRAESGAPVAISGTCTHLGCTVQWDAAKGEFLCPCHQGRYDATGTVIAGPPPAPLAPVETEVRDGDVFIKVAG